MITDEQIKDTLSYLEGISSEETALYALLYAFGCGYMVATDSFSLLVFKEEDGPENGVLFQFRDGSWRAIGKIKETD